MNAVDLDTVPPMPREPFPETQAWHGSAIPPESYLVPIPAECLRELDAVIAEQRAAPVPTLLLDPRHFDLAATRRWVEAVRERLDHGAGMAVLDRLPVERLSRQEIVDIYWLLGSLIEPPVAQEWKGTVIYDVRHDGQDFTQDTRAALTPLALDMHNDSSMGEAPPNYVSLLCLNTARSGGMSCLSSALAAHNHLHAHRPDLLRRLYQPFYRNHQDYQAADAASRNYYPVFTLDNGIRTRFNARIIFRGYEKTGQTLDAQGAEAIREMDSFLGDARNRLELWMEPGQIQILNNRVILHGRTPYEDWEEPERKRHLLRLWLRAGDRRQFRG